MPNISKQALAQRRNWMRARLFSALSAVGNVAHDNLAAFSHEREQARAIAKEITLLLRNWEGGKGVINKLLKQKETKDV